MPMPRFAPSLALAALLLPAASRETVGRIHRDDPAAP
jgi:hypothetical protein